METFLKFLEANCPGDDAHNGCAEPNKPLLERCSMCASIYEAAVDAVKSETAKLRSEVERLNKDASINGKHLGDALLQVNDLRRLMGHWSTVELAVKWQSQVMKDLDAAKRQVGELKEAVFMILGVVQGSHTDPYREIQALAKVALERCAEKPNDDLPALKKWGDIVDGGAEKRVEEPPKGCRCPNYISITTDGRCNACGEVVS